MVLGVIALTFTTAPGMTGAEETTPELKALVEAAGLMPWTFRGNPSFDLPDASGRTRSLATDFKGRVVLLYMLAEW
jgi:hypothetical protein